MTLNGSNGANESSGKNRRSLLRLTVWAACGLVLPIFIGAALIVATINTDGAHRYLIGLAERQASEQLGVQVRLQNFVLHMGTLSVDLYGLQAAGASPYDNPPLLSVDHVGIGVRVISVLGRKWYFDRLQVDHPVVWLLVDKNGVSNLPKLKSNGSSQTSVFDLGIRHAVVDRGEIYYNDRPSSLTADLHNLDFRASFDSVRKAYDGRLAYSNARLRYGTLRPTQHDLDAEFEATPTTFVLKRAKVASGNSEADLAATMTGYSNPKVQGQYQLRVDCGEMAQLLRNASLPSGIVYTSGSIEYAGLPDHSLLQSLTIRGQLNSPTLVIRSAQIRGEVKDVAAQYSLANGDATLNALRAALLGGEMTARGKMMQIGGNSHTNLQTELQRISLADIQRIAGSALQTANLAMTGTADATASANWGKNLSDLMAHADLTIHGEAAPARNRTRNIVVANGAHTEVGSTSAGPLPIQGVFHATYTNREQALRLDNSYLRTPQTNVSLNGIVSRGSALTVDVEANDLRELAAVAESFSTSNTGQTPMDLAGRASFHGTVRGAVSAPRITGQLNAQSLHVNGSDWKVVRADVDASPTYALLQNADLEPAQRGRITANVGMGLSHWSVTRQSSIQADVTGSQIDIPMLAKLIGNPVPVSGSFDMHLRAHGTLQNPEGNGDLTLTKVIAYEQPISSARVDFSGSGNQAQARMSVRLPAGAIQGRVTADPQSRTFSAQIDSSGIDLSRLQALEARGIDAKGNLAIHAHGNGSFDNPEAGADVQMSSLTISGQNFSGLKLQMNLANRILNAEMTSSAASATIHAKGKVNLSGDYLTDASFDTQSIPLQAIMAAVAPSEADQISGQTEVHGTLHGPLKQVDKLQAHVTIPVLRIGYGDTIQLAAVAPIQADYADGSVRLQPATIRGTGTDLQLQGTVPIKSGMPMSLQAHGSVDLQLVQLFDPELRSSGKLQVNINSNGSTAGGEIDIVDANLASTISPVGLQHGNGVLKLTPDHIEVAKFEGAIGGGEVTAQGAIAYRPTLQFDLGAVAKGVRMLYPQGVRETINANIRLTGSMKNAVLGGSVNLADLSFTPAFDLSNITEQFSSGVTAPTQPGFAQNLALNLAVNSSSNVNLQSRTLSVGGSANLQIRGTAEDPVVLGRISLNNGDLIFNGNRYVLTGGTVQFINPSMTEPVVNLSMSTTIQEYKINLRFNGPVDQLSTQYSSNPALPPADIINLLAFGQTTEASAQNTTPASQQAESLVASQVSSQVTSRISKAAGISQLSISPVLGGGSTSAGAQLTIQQRVTGNLFITFSTNVATTQGQIIQGQYQVTPRVAVSATRDPNGGFAFDTLIRKSW